MKLRLLITALFLTLLVGCKPSKVEAVRLSEIERRRVSELLAKLDDAIREKHPEVFSRFAGPASPEDVRVLRDSLGGAEVEAAELWFHWHNGASREGVSLLPLGWSIGVTDSVSAQRALRFIPFMYSRRKSGVKFLDDGAGDGYFLDVKDSKPRVFYHMLQDSNSYQDFGTLEEFIEFCIAAQKISGGTGKSIDFEAKSYQTLESEYLRKISLQNPSSRS